MNKHKINALSKGLSIYYSDTDSLVLDGKLPSELVHPTELGKFKLEHEVKEGIFISGKTYCLVLKDGTLVKRAKGVDSESLSYEDYLSLLKDNDVTGIKRSSDKNYSKGSVNIYLENILLKGDSYSRRVKLYDDNNKWVNTKPLYIDNLWLKSIPVYISTDLSLIVYIKPCLHLTIINNIKPVFNSIIIPPSELEKVYELKTRLNSIYEISYSNYYREYISLFRSVYTNISSYCINIFNGFKYNICQLKGDLLVRGIKYLTISGKNKHLITKAIIYITPILIFISKSDINYSFLLINKYIY